MTFSSAHRWQGFPYFALAALVFGAACSSEPTGTTPPSDVTQTSAADAVKPGGLVHQLGKGLAISLNDQAVRSWVKREIDRSPYVEQRIRLTKNLQELSSPEIKLLLDNAKLGSAGASDVRSVPELELYFPIASQLKAWRGEAPVRVAVPLKRDETYMIYSLDGTARRSRGDYVPNVPTLLLGVSEVDYDDVESAVRGGSRTGDMMSAVARQMKPQFSFGISTAQHTRVTYFRTTEWHDDIFGGTDEVEIFASTLNWFISPGSTNHECYRHTNVSRGAHNYLANVPATTIATAVPTGSDQVFIHAYEDDNQGCVFHRGDDDFYGKISLTIGQYGTIWGTIRDSGAPGHIDIRVHAGTP